MHYSLQPNPVHCSPSSFCLRHLKSGIGLGFRKPQHPELQWLLLQKACQGEHRTATFWVYPHLSAWHQSQPKAGFLLHLGLWLRLGLELRKPSQLEDVLKSFFLPCIECTLGFSLKGEEADKWGRNSSSLLPCPTKKKSFFLYSRDPFLIWVIEGQPVFLQERGKGWALYIYTCIDCELC